MRNKEVTWLGSCRPEAALGYLDGKKKGPGLVERFLVLAFRHGIGDISRFVPPNVLAALREKLGPA